MAKCTKIFSCSNLDENVEKSMIEAKRYLLKKKKHLIFTRTIRPQSSYSFENSQGIYQFEMQVFRSDKSNNFYETL